MKKVLVIGGGIGGLSAALALRKAGIAVDLVEINREWTVYHVGIVVQGNALRAMSVLGIAEECVAAGFPSEGLEFRDFDDHLLADIPGDKVAGPSCRRSRRRSAFRKTSSRRAFVHDSHAARA